MFFPTVWCCDIFRWPYHTRWCCIPLQRIVLHGILPCCNVICFISLHCLFYTVQYDTLSYFTIWYYRLVYCALSLIIFVYIVKHSITPCCITFYQFTLYHSKRDHIVPFHHSVWYCSRFSHSILSHKTFTLSHHLFVVVIMHCNFFICHEHIRLRHIGLR